ncbi:hypothetical protein D9V34_00980 [Mycetocola lacteus]|uniref:Uncharacterized protein n=1 Tax=Mycetocola lacteus TaxID=76637 RepID=A0A3L7AK81_9MICO|nr:hypothetical protein D9V34_13275 [Mycetocola lacteus]RLP84604.1 hypothetical protein D9V34_00980 [Mycetocola lacteus]
MIFIQTDEAAFNCTSSPVRIKMKIWNKENSTWFWDTCRSLGPAQMYGGQFGGFPIKYKYIGFGYC